MDNRNFFLFKVFFSLVILFSIVETVLSVDKDYEACVPSNCGKGPTINYPFWIKENQRSTCGYPGFELSCKNSEPILKLSGEEYIIRDIVYRNQSFTIIKAGLSNDICSPPSYNLIFSQSPFRYAPTVVNLSFFFSCTGLLSHDYLRYSLGCGTAEPRNLSVALFADDPLLPNLREFGECESPVVIPVDKSRNGSLDTSISRESVVDFLNKGFHLRWTATSCDDCENSGGRCGFDFEQYKFMCFCTDRPYHRRCGGTNMRKKKLTIGLSVGMGVVLAITLVFCCLRISKDNSIIFWKDTKKAHRMVEEFLKNYGSLAPTRYHYSDIKKITHSFKHKIGQGGYGGVYKGKLLDGRLVAVKLLDKAKGDGEEFINEVASISRTSHVNIVSLVGFCFDGSKRALIYEFMVNGSLEKFIYDPNSLEAKSQLGWEMLYRITVGVARGLEYLHRGCNTRILHFDIKPHNILLDHDFTPKISDFGLAKLCPNKESVVSMLDARGTAGYIAPEVFSRHFGGVSHKSDVYSYGMMVLEIVGRRKNINVQVDHTSEIYFPQWIYKRLILDEDLELYGVTSQDETEIAKKMVVVALWCIQTNPADRPSMSRVVEMFEGRNETLPIPPKPYLCSPPRSPVRSPNT